MASDAVVRSSLVENAMQAMMSEQQEYNQRRRDLVYALPYVTFGHLISACISCCRPICMTRYAACIMFHTDKL